eukprot:4144978-Prymnesium_polylepis.2
MCIRDRCAAWAEQGVAGLHICTRKDFRPRGFAWERVFVKATSAQHVCAEGDGTHVAQLIPRSLSVNTEDFTGTCEPHVVVGFM